MSIFSKLFNSEKKDTTYNGTKPVTSLSQVQGGPEYYKKITDRSNGIGVGYGDNYTSNANPQIAQLHNQYTGYQLPELKSELTATGRRAGSSGFQQISRSMSDQADKENAIMARLMQNEAEAKHNDVASAIGNVGNYAQNETGLVNTRANFDYNDNNRQVQEANQRRANEATGLQNMVYAGSDMISSLYGGGQGVGQRQAPQVASYGGGNPNVGFGQSGNSYNQRIQQRYAQAGRVR